MRRMFGSLKYASLVSSYFFTHEINVYPTMGKIAYIDYNKIIGVAFIKNIVTSNGQN